MATNFDIITQAKMRLNAGTPSNGWEDFEIEIASCLPAALGIFAQEVMNDDHRRGLLQQSYPVTLTTGIGNLSTAVGATTSVAGEILSEGVHLGTVIDANGNLVHPLMSYQAYLSPQPTIFNYYCLVNNRIYTRDGTVAVTGPNDIVGLSGDLTIFASYAPADCASVPAEITDDLVEVLCRICLQKIKPQVEVSQV